MAALHKWLKWCRISENMSPGFSTLCTVIQWVHSYTCRILGQAQCASFGQGFRHHEQLRSQLAALATPEEVKASPNALDSVFVAPVSQVSFPSLTMRCHFSSEVSYLLLPSQAVKLCALPVAVKLATFSLILACSLCVGIEKLALSEQQKCI